MRLCICMCKIAKSSYKRAVVEIISAAAIVLHFQCLQDVEWYWNTER